MKNRNADDTSFQIGRSSQPGGSRSGSNTPLSRQRQGGAISVSIVEKPKSSAGVGSGKGKGKVEKIWDVPKSKEVKKIEAIIASLRSIQESGPKPGEGYNCFCQGKCGSLWLSGQAVLTYHCSSDAPFITIHSYLSNMRSHYLQVACASSSLPFLRPTPLQSRPTYPPHPQGGN